MEWEKVPEREVHRALSSNARVETLKLLYKRPHDIDEIAKKLNLQPVTMRHHILALQEAGLLESYEERTGAAGRPKTYYKIAKTLPNVSFPARRYLYFSKGIIHTLIHELGQEKACEMLAQVGQEMGRETVKYLETAHSIKAWTPKEFAEVFVEKNLQEMGVEPEIVEKTDKKVVYRTHNCVFFELSQELPNLMCDVLHSEFHQSLSKAMNKNTKIVQTKCMGHGEACCEQVFEWITGKQISNDLN